MSGFILLEVAFAILVLGVVSTLGLTGYRAICEHRAYSTTEQRIERTFVALAHFAKRTGSLPCPTTPESMGVAPNQGVMDCPQLVGMVPYATLGMSEREAMDGWQRPLVYAADPTLHPSPLHIQSSTYIPVQAEDSGFTNNESKGEISSSLEKPTTILKSNNYILEPFCEATPTDLSITHQLGEPASTTHPAVVLLSHGPHGA